MSNSVWNIVACMIGGGLLLPPLGGIGIAALGGAVGIGWWLIGGVISGALSWKATSGKRKAEIDRT